MQTDRFKRVHAFLNETLEYFLSRCEGVDRDRYFADRDKRSILDKSINDIILAVVDLSEECLKRRNRAVPDTYRDTILACHEFAGEAALKVAPLVKHRNEMIHQYLKINWQNIVTVKNRIDDIRGFADKLKTALSTNIAADP